MLELLLGGAAPSHIAIRDARYSLSRAELSARAATEARWLRSTGVRRFALLADNGVPFALADLALLESGMVNVPVPGYFTREQVGHLVEDAGLDAVLTDRPDHPAWRDAGFCRAGSSPGSGLSLLRREVRDHPPLHPGTIKITYTSGSTGTPKGVCLTAATLLKVAGSLAGATRTAGAGRHLCLLPLPTLLENVAGIYSTLLAGGSCDIPALASTGVSYGEPDGGRLLETLDQLQPGSIILVPELLRFLVGGVDSGWRPPASLRFIAVGGATVSTDLLAAADAAGLPVFEGYGLSECGSVVCLNTAAARRAGSVGKPLPHARLRLADDGEIHVRGAIMAGYLGEPAPVGDEIATGDLGAVDNDGYWYVRGRRKNLLITSLGRNVAPEWVEAELAREPAISTAMVVGEGRPHLAALISPAAGESSVTAIAVAVERANSRLPDYAQVRRFAVADRPFANDGLLTPNGRPRRDRILARYAHRVEALYEESRPC
jgi:long-subunit acyl-CoA synthetase (AMP-forming)